MALNVPSAEANANQKCKPKQTGPYVAVPPVHGRPHSAPGVKNRIGYHQRNLSLDFR